MVFVDKYHELNDCIECRLWDIIIRSMKINKPILMRSFGKPASPLRTWISSKNLFEEQFAIVLTYFT